MADKWIKSDSDDSDTTSNCATLIIWFASAVYRELGPKTQRMKARKIREGVEKALEEGDIPRGKVNEIESILER